MTRSECLDEAKRIVTVDRNKPHGEPEDNFALIASLWGAYLQKDLVPADIANLMILFKVARNASNCKADNWIDICGYAARGSEVSERAQPDSADGGFLAGLLSLFAFDANDAEDNSDGV